MSAHDEASVEAEALRLWRERELTFPAYTRRMKPDDFDRTTGAWATVETQARANLSWGMRSPVR
jgi:hypothetical protein